MVAVCLLAVIVELFNSIEAVLDRISLEKHAFQKAKDMRSAAQFSALLIIFIIWSLFYLSH
jgi:diacylglycerol kinase (ATP)